MNQNQQNLLGAIEAGGTKWLCSVAEDPSQPLKTLSFPTTSPTETIKKVVLFFEEVHREFGQISSLGIGSFGPIDRNPNSASYGDYLNTPKDGWGGFSLLSELRKHDIFQIPIHFDTDVNTAVVAEAKYGEGRHYKHVAYLTVGTGIGGAFYTEGRTLNGKMHTELGHMLIPCQESDREKAINICPFHEECLEGWASGPAIEKRWGISAKSLPDDHEAWDLEAKYLAHAAVNITALWSPEVIIFGGGVSQNLSLFPLIRKHFSQLAQSYWNLPELENYIRPTAMNDKAGLIGAFLIAQNSLENS